MMQHCNGLMWGLLVIFTISTTSTFAQNANLEARSLAAIGPQVGHSASISSVAFSPDGKTVATGSSDKTARLWDVQTGKLMATLEGHTKGIATLAISPGGKTLATGSGDRTIRLWDMMTGKLKDTLEGHEHWITALAFSPDGTFLATAGEREAVRLWDTASGRLQAVLEGNFDGTFSLTFSPDSKLLAAGAWRKSPQIWDVETRQLKAALQNHPGLTSRIPLSADSVKIEMRAIAFSPDGKTLAAGSRDKTGGLWDAANGQLKATLKGHNDIVFVLAFSPDGATLATGGWDATVRLWDAKTGQPKATLQGNKGLICALAFSPDGKTLATGSRGDGAVRLWDIESGQLKAKLEGHTEGVTTLAYSPDGKKLVTGSSVGETRLWDAQTGKIIWYEEAQEDESPPQTDYKFPSPRKPGKRVGGVISNEKAEETLEDSFDVRWDTNSRNPYAYYTITIRNNGTQTLECLLRAMIYINSHETDKKVQSNWNVDEKQFKLKPGEIKTIKGKIEWYGDENVYPGFEHEILAMFSK